MSFRIHRVQVSSPHSDELPLDTFWINGVFMTDLTLDEFSEFSEEQLKQVLREEAIKAGFVQKCSQGAKGFLIDTSCGHSFNGKSP